MPALRPEPPPVMMAVLWERPGVMLFVLTARWWLETGARPLGDGAVAGDGRWQNRDKDFGESSWTGTMLGRSEAENDVWPRILGNKVLSVRPLTSITARYPKASE